MDSSLIIKKYELIQTVQKFGKSAKDVALAYQNYDIVDLISKYEQKINNDNINN